MSRRQLSLSTVTAMVLVLALPAGVAAASPGATTSPATQVTATTATVNGTVDPNKQDTTYHFEYGKTAAYGSSTPAQGPVKGNSGKSVSSGLTQLAPSTVYHFRLVATNASGTAQGADRTFTTLAAGQAPPGGNAVTIGATPASVVFGKPTTISGQVTGSKNSGVEVTLQEQPLPLVAGAKFSDVATSTTDATGHYAFAVTPQRNTQYQVRAKTSPPATSPVLRVNVRIAVTFRLSDSTPKRGTRVRFFGVAKPAHDGAVVLIQRRASNGKFRTVAKTVLRISKTVGQSRYSKRLRISRSGVYRVRVPHDADHSAGTSRKRRVRVH
jgi:hypothetical protein